MSKVRFIFNNLLDSAISITSSSETLLIYLSDVSYGVTQEPINTTPMSVVWVPGSNTKKQSIKISANVAGSQFSAGDYLHTTFINNTVIFWYSVSLLGNAPNFGEEVYYKKIDIETGYTAQQVKDATYAAVLEMSAFFVLTPTFNVNETGAELENPVENIINISKSKVFRTLDASDVFITGIFNRNQKASAIVLANHNFPENTRYRIEFFGTNTPEISAPIFTTGYLLLGVSDAYSTTVPWGSVPWGFSPWGVSYGEESEIETKPNLVYWIPTVKEGIKSFRISLSITEGFPGSIAYADYFEIGRVYIGKYIEPMYNFSFGHSLTWMENTSQFRTDSGTLRSDFSIPFRKIEFNLATIPESDRQIFQHEFKNIGLRKDFFVSMFPTNAEEEKINDYSGIFKITKEPVYSEIQNNYYRSSLVLEEV